MNICGYKSGAFKPSELHYHSTFKEILAVKHGIEKFQFHLLGHNFLVEMDMSSFPKCSSSKGKCSHILSYSDGQIGFHNGLFKSSILKVRITLSLITFPRNLQPLIPQLSPHLYVYILLQTHPHPQAPPLHTLMISLI